MRVKLLYIGKNNVNYVNDGLKVFEKRLKRYFNFEVEGIKDIKHKKNMSVEEIKNEEGRCFMQKLNPKDSVFLLDDKGKTHTSETFANEIQNCMNNGVSSLVFIIGGAYGFSNEIYSRYKNKLSLSKMTFSHQLVRLVFSEQLYRAMTILNNEPYHHS